MWCVRLRRERERERNGRMHEELGREGGKREEERDEEEEQGSAICICLISFT